MKKPLVERAVATHFRESRGIQRLPIASRIWLELGKHFATARQRRRYAQRRRRAQKRHEAEPLDILLLVANDATIDVDVRVRAAQAAAPYVHRRKPLALEAPGKFEFLTPEEVESRRQLLLEELRAGVARRAPPPSEN